MQFVKNHKFITALICVFILVNLVLTILAAQYRWPTVSYLFFPKPNLTDSQKLIISGVTEDIDEEESFELVKKTIPLAQNAPYLEIGSCSPRPVIVKAKVNSEFRFTNSTNEPRTLIFGDKQIYFNPNESKLVLLDFFHFVPAVYGYTCNYSTGPVGVMLIEE